ncbi:MAG: HD domain-containing phosphohydrolase [Planctomycetota bacterium]
MSEKILCVDDDPNILQGYQRRLRKQCDIETALGGTEGLEAIASKGPFAVIVSDMRMPGMDGVQFLAAAKQRAPDSVRMMLTGHADQETAVEAVNEGNIFRFLTKPCPPETFAKALTAGIEQYRLVTAEKVLLEKTLRGAIKVLTDVLSLTNPTAYGHASRVRRLVQKLCKHLEVEQSWQAEVAAMLSQIGCVTVPPNTLNKVYYGQMLTADESQMLEAHPSVGRDLVANIPRLETVAEIIAYQQKCFDGSGSPSDSAAGKEIPLGARVLKVAIDYDTLKWSGLADLEAIAELRKHSERYDPDVLAALGTIGTEESLDIQEVWAKDLRTYMIVADDVTTTDGTLLVSKGQEVTTSMRQRLMNFARNGRIEGPIRVLVRAESGSRAAQSVAR